MIELPEIKRKKPRPAYRKSEAVKELERLADKQAQLSHPSIDKKYLAPRRFRDDHASGLTACIVKYVSLTGSFASRLNNMGVYRGGKYTRSTSRRGLPDILITKGGQSIFVEVKCGKDRMSSFQKEVQEEQRRSGGLYMVASSFEQFKSWFDTLS